MSPLPALAFDFLIPLFPERLLIRRGKYLGCLESMTQWAERINFLGTRVLVVREGGGVLAKANSAYVLDARRPLWRYINQGIPRTTVSTAGWARLLGTSMEILP
jgi:hypothetical protein